MACSILGIDVGGDGVKAASVDLAHGTVSGRIRVAMPQPAGPEAVAEAVAGLVRKFPEGEPVGCALPAVVRRGLVRTAGGLNRSWIGVDASTLLSLATERPCVVLNDTDAACVAEARYGAARRCHGLVVMVAIGAGVDTALVQDGELVPNAALGRLIVDGHVARKWVSDAKRRERELSWRKWARRLDRYLTDLNALLWPDLIVIGGDVATHADRFIDRIDPGCDVRVATLGNLASIAGAARWAHEHTLG